VLTYAGMKIPAAIAVHVLYKSQISLIFREVCSDRRATKLLTETKHLKNLTD